MRNDLALELIGVSKSFGGSQALRHLTFSLRRGSFLGILGPNGAGKTTALRVLLGLVTPEGGAAFVLGRRVTEEAVAIRSRVGVLLETDGLYERLTAWQNLEYHGRIHHIVRSERDGRIGDVLRSFGLWDRRSERVVTWSKGMRQRLAVARAVLHRPELLLLDEPFSGMDPVAAVELRGRLRSLAQEQGITVVLTTHDLSHVERACDDVAVLQAGSVVARGSPGEIFAEKETIELVIVGRGLTPELLDSLRTTGVLLSYEMIDGQVRARCAQSGRSRLSEALANRGVIIEEMRAVSVSLEERYVSFARGSRPLEVKDE